MKMKNRSLANALYLLMVILCVIGLTACGKDDKCAHQFGDCSTTINATCTEAGSQERKCSACGETETSKIDALGHDWNEATCSAPKTCKVCSATEGAASAHAYTVEAVKDEALKSAATCTGAAVYYKSCSCGNISASDADTFTSGSVLEHIDTNKDHACDHGCDKNFGEHADGDDNDHLCDYGCEKIADDGCYDTVADGKCDECGANIDHTCVDENKDHACDICVATMGTHDDTTKDHICEYGCADKIGACEDTDKDHDCDYGCNKTFGTCQDADKNHDCDYGCNKTFGTCKDADKDHDCDYGCNKTFGTCKDADKDHDCDYGCKKTFGTCKDADKDHDCDYGCAKTFGEHTDGKDNGHLCDYGCGLIVSTGCYDTTADGKCDECGIDLKIAWMARLDNAKKLNELSLPGTHNSGATKSLLGSGQCQDTTIKEQLNVGVRFFDIRLKLQNNELKVVHSIVDQKLTFESVLEDINAFITENPTEFLIVSIKQDADPSNSTVSFSQKVEEMLKKYDKICNDRSLPSNVGGARGKIFILSRYSGATVGIPASSGWADSTSFVISGLYVQDKYKITSIEQKTTEIEKAISIASQKRYSLVINFASCYFESDLLPSASKTAKEINPYLCEMLKDKTAPLGAILCDYITQEICNIIIENNF